MSPPNSRPLPEIFVPDDPKWASRAAQRGEIRRLARGLYSTNLDEPAEQLIRRRWYDVAALYFPRAVIADRSAFLAGPTGDGSLFLDSGPRPVRPRPVELPGLTLRPRSGPGPVDGDMPFVDLFMSSRPRMYLDNMRPSRARASVRRTLRRSAHPILVFPVCLSGTPHSRAVPQLIRRPNSIFGIMIRFAAT